MPGWSRIALFLLTLSLLARCFWSWFFLHCLFLSDFHEKFHCVFYGPMFEFVFVHSWRRRYCERPRMLQIVLVIKAGSVRNINRFLKDDIQYYQKTSWGRTQRAKTYNIWTRIDYLQNSCRPCSCQNRRLKVCWYKCFLSVATKYNWMVSSKIYYKHSGFWYLNWSSVH